VESPDKLVASFSRHDPSRSHSSEPDERRRVDSLIRERDGRGVVDIAVCGPIRARSAATRHDGPNLSR
jgi:hypothetical protein